MKSSTCRLLAGTVLALAAASAQALKAPEVDLRDPTLWEEKTANPLTANQPPCEVFSGPHCAVWEDEKSDIQRERSVGNSGGGIAVMKICGENSVYSEITRASPGYVWTEKSVVTEMDDGTN